MSWPQTLATRRPSTEMPPAGGQKSKAYSSGIATQADDVKYKTKYKELKAKISEIEEDNTKLQLRVLKSKKNIQRLRVERAILYDRLQSSAQPTNPFALHAAPHLVALEGSQPSPASIFDPAPYPLANSHGPDLYLEALNARKLAAVRDGDEFGQRPEFGIAGEQDRKRAREVSPLGDEAPVASASGNGVAPAPASEPVPKVEDGMQVDQVV